MKPALPITVFLSHNSSDKPYARRLAAATAVTGANVWFDEWSVLPGDSIPGAIDEGLARFDVFALLWSKAAADSGWVRTEMHAAVVRCVNNKSVRLVPICLDATPLPTLIQHVRHIDATAGAHIAVARELLGIQSETSYRLAVQAFIEEAGLEFREFWGAGVFVACPKCGAPADRLHGFQQTDPANDRTYAGVQCTVCRWSDGSDE